jgi:hypothetical protein
MTTGLAMKMQLDLAHLMRRHGYVAETINIPLAAAVDHAVEISGLASTTDIDLSRQKFRAYAFDNLCLTLSG